MDSMNTRAYQACFNTAIRLLTHRDHSCRELERKLSQRQYQQNHIQPTIAECRRLNYLDDEKFAQQYTGQLQRRGYGQRRIQQMLAAKGVARRLISEAVIKNCSEKKELQTCRKVLEKKLKAHGTRSREGLPTEKLQRFLSGRGFSPAIIRKIMNDVLS